MVVKHLKGHEGRVYVSVRSLLLVGLCTHPHLNAAGHTPNPFYQLSLLNPFNAELFKSSQVLSYLILSSVSLWLILDTLIPVFEGVVDYSPQQQSVTNLRRSSEGEHVDGPQSRVSLTQTTAWTKREITQ